MASNGMTLRLVSPLLCVISTIASSTLPQSKHWIIVPKTNPIVCNASISPGHLRLPIPNGIMNNPSNLPFSNLWLELTWLFPNHWVSLDGSHVDKQHRSAWDVVATDFAIRR